MPRVTIKREGGLTVEADVSFDQLKELLGVNGHGTANPVVSHTSKKGFERDVNGFFAELKSSERGAKFVAAMNRHPEGIEANAFALLLGYTDAKQVGGYTGGGVAKIAKKYGIEMEEIYSSEVTFPNKKRTRMFYPGSLLK